MNKCLTWLVLGLCLGVLGGCSSTTPVATYTSPITGLRTDLLSENLLDTTEQTREMLWLNASRVFKTRETWDYYLEVHYAARPEAGFLDINPGQALTLIVDGKEMKFGGIGSLNSRKSGNDILHEDALFEAGMQDMAAIAYAKKVTVRVTGANGVVVREFGQQNFDKFKAFLEQVSVGRE